VRIAVITSKYPFSRSAEAFFAAEERALLADVDDLVLAPLHSSGNERFFRSRARAIRLPGRLRVARDAAVECARSPLRTLGALRAVALHSESLLSLLKNLAIFPRSLYLARQFRLAAIDHVHAYWLSTPATAAFVIAQVLGISWSASAHRWDIYARNMTKNKCRSAAFIRAISQEGASALRDKSGRHDSIECVRVGVRLPNVASIDTPRQEPAFLCAASFVPVKGHDALLEACSQLRRAGRHFRLDLAGDGPLRAHIEQSILRLDLQHDVRLLGHVEHDDLIDLMQAGTYRAVVLTSIQKGSLKEGVPVSLIEAMAAGIPCIATDSGSVRELVFHPHGMLVRRDHVDELTEAMRRLLDDPFLAQSMGTAARRHVEAHYDASTNVRRLTYLMQSAVQHSSAISAQNASASPARL